MSLRIDYAREQDVPLILGFIRQLAEYEKLSHQVAATEQTLRETLFGERPYAEVLIAHWDEEAVGFALFFHNYSTFLLSLAFIWRICSLTRRRGGAALAKRY